MEKREVVDLLKRYSEGEGGGFSVYIPSLKRERDVTKKRLLLDPTFAELGEILGISCKVEFIELGGCGHGRSPHCPGPILAAVRSIVSENGGLTIFGPTDFWDGSPEPDSDKEVVETLKLSEGVVDSSGPTSLIGALVRIKGLKSKAELNGRAGKVTSYFEGDNKFAILLDDGSGPYKIKADNFTVEPPRREDEEVFIDCEGPAEAAPDRVDAERAVEVCEGPADAAPERVDAAPERAVEACEGPADAAPERVVEVHGAEAALMPSVETAREPPADSDSPFFDVIETQAEQHDAIPMQIDADFWAKATPIISQPEDMSPVLTPALTPEARVAIHGLLMQTELNGQIAVVMSYIASSDRFVVKLSNGKQIKIKAENLVASPLLLATSINEPGVARHKKDHKSIETYSWEAGDSEDEADNAAASPWVIIKVRIPGIDLQHKDFVSCYFTSDSVELFVDGSYAPVEEREMSNRYLIIRPLANSVLPDDCSCLVTRDLITIKLRKDPVENSCFGHHVQYPLWSTLKKTPVPETTGVTDGLSALKKAYEEGDSEIREAIVSAVAKKASP